MESLEKDHSYSENPQQSETSAYEVQEAVGSTRRLRDRELLRKRKAEAEEKHTHQVQSKSKRSRRGRGAGRGRGQHQATEPATESQPGGVEEKSELTVPPPEEKAAEPSPNPQGEASSPPVETEELYTPTEAAEATPAGPAVCPVELEETPRSEEPEMRASVANDHLEQEFYPLL